MKVQKSKGSNQSTKNTINQGSYIFSDINSKIDSTKETTTEKKSNILIRNGNQNKMQKKIEHVTIYKKPEIN